MSARATHDPDITADGMTGDGRVELGEATGTPIVPDRQPRLGEPPPVRLVSVDDVRLPVPPGVEAAMDGFYVGLWRFRKEPAPAGGRDGDVVYKAENARLRFTVVSDPRPVERDGVRPQGIIVPSVRDAERLLVDAEVEYDRQRGLQVGPPSLLCRDPGGNWVELVELPKV